MKKIVYFTALVLTVIGLSPLFASCSDEPGSGKNDLVGTWYYMDGEEIDMDDYIIFEKNGTYRNSYGDTGTYKYKSSSSTIIYYDGEDEYEEELIFVSKDKIMLDGSYYVRL